MNLNKKARIVLLGTITSVILLTGCSAKSLNSSDVLINGKYLSSTNIENLYTYDSEGKYTMLDNLYNEILDTYEAKNYDIYTEFNKYLKSEGITEINSENYIQAQSAYTNFKNQYLEMFLYQDALGISEKEIKKEYEKGKKTRKILQIGVPTTLSDSEEFATKIQDDLNSSESINKDIEIAKSRTKELNKKVENEKEKMTETESSINYIVVDYSEYQLEALNSEGNKLIKSLDNGKAVVVDNTNNGNVFTVFKLMETYDTTYVIFKMNYLNAEASNEGISSDLSKLLEKLNENGETSTNFPKDFIKDVKNEVNVRNGSSESENTVTKEEQEQQDKEAKELEEKLNKSGDLKGDSAEDMEESVNTFTK